MSNPDNNDNRRKKNPFDPFSGDFNDFFKYISRMMEDFFSSDFSDISDKMFSNEKPFVWGFSFTRGSDVKPKYERFGDNFSINKESDSELPDENASREPVVDILEEPGIIRVIAELPGVEKDQIDLRTTGARLILKAKGDRNRLYKKEVHLPAEVIPESSNAKFKNGVLEIEFKRKNPENGQKIAIN